MIKIVVHHTKNITRLATKLVKFAGKKTLHIFFPPVVHYLTDKYQNKYQHLVVDTIFAAVAIVLIAINIGLGYWFYMYFTPTEIDLRVGQPAYVISGHEIEYTVSYFNKTKPIKDFQILLLYPEGFTPLEDKNIYQIGDLEKNDFGEIKIKGSILGDVGEEQAIKVIYGYTYRGNFFQAEVEHDYEIMNSSFEVYTELPTAILQQEEFSWQIKYKNNSSIERKNVKVKLDLPQHLNILESSLNYDAEKQEIIIPQVAAKSQGEINLRGQFTEFGDASQVITVTTSLGKAEKFYIQNIERKAIDVLTPRLEVSALVNGREGAVADLGDYVNYYINYQNIGDIELKNINIITDFDNYFEDRVFSIESLEPGQAKNINFSVKSNAAWRINNLKIISQTSATAQVGDLDILTYSQSDNTEVKFNTALDFVTRASYYGPNGEQLGYGPYPPQAGEVTSLRVFWQVEDITNSLSNITIKTVLPSQVEWTGATSVSAGTNITYDSAKQEVTWHLGSLAAFTHPQGASFEVRVLPNWQQVGQKINLTNITAFTAIDAFTGSYLERINTPIQTDYIIK